MRWSPSDTNNLRAAVQLAEGDSGPAFMGKDTLMDWQTFTIQAEDAKPQREREQTWMR